jgi:hypothetical protein
MPELDPLFLHARFFRSWRLFAAPCLAFFLGKRLTMLDVSESRCT